MYLSSNFASGFEVGEVVGEGFGEGEGLGVVEGKGAVVVAGAGVGVDDGARWAQPPKISALIIKIKSETIRNLFIIPPNICFEIHSHIRLIS